MTVFRGKAYEFYEADPELYQGGSKIRGVYEEGYTDARYQSLFKGQVIAMFGDENLTDDNEELLSYIVAADYVHECVYEDCGVMVRMGVKDGEDAI